MNDEQLLRYSRHILLDDIGIEGQQRLQQAHALVIGAGGLGSPVALYLGTAGVGQITLVDDDCVELTNLQRQIAHTVARIGTPKVDSAAQSIAAINPDVSVTALQQRADAALLDVWVARADVVLDCSDNFTTRQAVNRACVAHGKPLVSGAALGFDGQISVYDSRYSNTPCYACLFPPDSAIEEAQCATMGVFAPLVGIIGSMQAAEALKLLISGPIGQADQNVKDIQSGLHNSLAGRLQMLDARRMEWSEIRVQIDPECSVCKQSKHLEPIS